MKIADVVIDYSDLIDKMRALATEEPDRYAECMYVSDDQAVFDEQGLEIGTPCCIVGHALIASGVPASYFLGIGFDTETDDGTGRNNRSFNAMSGVDNDDHRVGWINSVQSHQDGGESWGEAVFLADKGQA